MPREKLTFDCPDRFLTTDIAKFCETLSALYGNVCKPVSALRICRSEVEGDLTLFLGLQVLDLVIFTAQLSSSLGAMGTVGLFGFVRRAICSVNKDVLLTILSARLCNRNYFLTAALLRSLTPSFGTLAATLARLEGDYRAAVARIGINAEEISFYKGGLREKGILAAAWERLKIHWEGIAKVRVGYSMAEDFIIKYLWSAAGYGLMSIPSELSFSHARLDLQADMPLRFLHCVQSSLATSRPCLLGTSAMAERRITRSLIERRVSPSSPMCGERDVDSRSIFPTLAGYISNRRLLISLADAGGRLMLSYKCVCFCSSKSRRCKICGLKVVHPSDRDLAELSGHTSRVYSLISTLHLLNTSSYPVNERPPQLGLDEPFYDMSRVNGRVLEGVRKVKLEGVPVVAPAGGSAGAARGGEELIHSLDLAVEVRSSTPPPSLAFIVDLAAHVQTF